MLAITTLCWGGNAVFGRLAVGEVSPMVLVSLRWLGVLMLLAVFARQQVRKDFPVLRQNIGYVIAMGALGFTAFNGLFYVAAHTTTAVNIGIIQGSIPVFVLLGGFIAFRNPVGLLQIVGVAVTLIGVAVVASGGNIIHLSQIQFRLGDLLMLLACLLYALYAIGLRQRPKVSSMGLFTAMAASAFILSLPMSLTEAALGYFQWPTANGWAVIAAVVLLPSFLAQICFINSVLAIGPARAGVFVNLVPVFAAIFAVVFLQEPFKLYHALSLALVLGGIALSEWGKPA